MSTSILSPQDREHFLDHGYVIVKSAIPEKRVREWQELTWTRLGYDPADKSTWAEERVHLPPSRAVALESFAPRAYAATLEVAGGANRVQEPVFWADVLVCNLAEGADRPWQPPSADSPGWHKDGYFFKHFLDSPEQALLCIAAWTDILSHGGGTFIAPDSVGVVARYLAEHPEGVSARACGELIHQCREFVELTANAGDLVILHPYMLHAVSQNELRAARFITNPIVLLSEPMQLERPDGNYSLVEQCILRGLGVSSYAFEPAAPRTGTVPEWVTRVQRNLAGTEQVELEEAA